MTYQKKYDWESIKLEYIVGELITDEYGNETRKPYSTKRLAEKHGIPFGTLKEVCFKEKWVQDRNRLDVELKRRVTEEKVTQIFGESVISSSYTLKQLGKINQIIDAYLEPYLNLIDSDQATKNSSISVRTVINEDGYSNTEVLDDEDTKKINPRDIKDIVSIIKEVHQLKKSILGEEQLQVAVENIKVKDKAKKLKGSNKIESQLDMLLKERKRLENKLTSNVISTPETNKSDISELTFETESIDYKEVDEDDE